MKRSDQSQPRTRLSRVFMLGAVIAAMFAQNHANATWSICITNSKTGEVAIGTATCIPTDNLEKYVPVIRVGFGVGACQSQIDQTAANRKVIFSELPKGTDPAIILAMITAQDTKIQTRQIGIVDLQERGVTFTGTLDGAWAGGVVGHLGPMTYAIQGNVLTGPCVVQAIEAALLATPGDLAAKLMAGMQAARSMGGDGRCSCNSLAPDSCGCPPPSFVKSAHIGCMIIARIGDTDGTCAANPGCSNGVYYLNNNIKNSDGQGIDPDPVLQLQTLYDAWRSSWLGRPDHVLTEKGFSSSVIPADGAAQAVLSIQLKDWQGAIVGLPGAQITVTPEGSDNGIVTIGAATDQGNGLYTVPLTATTNLGKQKLRVVVDDGIGKVTLYPFPEIATVPATTLTQSATTVSALAGGDVDVALNGGPGLGKRNYLLLASASGSTPPLVVNNVAIPLVVDPAFTWSYLICNSPTLVNSCGAFDDQGTAVASLHFAPLYLHPLVFKNLTFSFVTLDPLNYASNPISIAVGP